MDSPHTSIRLGIKIGHQRCDQKSLSSSAKASLLKRIAYIAVFVAIAPQPAFAQEDTIILGIELSLGMDKSTVLGELRRLYSLDELPPENQSNYMVWDKKSQPHTYHGQVLFDSNNRLGIVVKDINLSRRDVLGSSLALLTGYAATTYPGESHHACAAHQPFLSSSSA